MASIGKDRGGRKRILFVAGDGKRKVIRMGKANMAQATAFKVKVEDLITGQFTGSIAAETARWVADLPDDMHSRLEAVGLVSERAANMTLRAFLDEYIRGRTDVKPQTAVVLGHTVRNLLAFFGAEKALRTVTKDDALAFRTFLVQAGLAEATIRRRCGIAKQFFAAAMEKGLLGKNPFKSKKLPCSARGNKERQFFVTRQTVDRILESCPDAQWRLIVVLARLGGLRTPSEILRLRWSDIDWAKGRLTVHSPKTEHHAGHESREAPLFPEIREYLMQVFEQAEPGTEHVVTRYRLNNLNLRQQFGRILAKAGVKPWPRLFQNLRSSRQTELCQDFPEHVVCCWMGNSKLVAREHYEQVRDEDFERAANCAQNPAQYPLVQPVLSRIAMEATRQESRENEGIRDSTTLSMAVQKGGMGPQGFEQPPLAAPKTPISPDLRTESGTPDARNGAQADPDLAEIVAAWPGLPDDVRRNILHVIHSYCGKTPER